LHSITAHPRVVLAPVATKPINLIKRSAISVARWLSPTPAKSCHKKLPDPPKNNVKNYQLKSAKNCEILRKKLLCLRCLKQDLQSYVSIFRLALTLNGPEVAGVTFSDSDSAPVPKFLNADPSLAIFLNWII